MINFFKLIPCFLLLMHIIGIQGDSVTTYADTDGYYWRDYTGIIPFDALPGGYDTAGRTTYIGLALYARSDGEATQVPGEIRPNSNKVFYEWGRVEHKAEQNLKIFCTPYPERFEWITTDTTGIRKLKKQLVLGGRELQFIIHIGRVHIEEALAVGKVAVVPEEYKHLDGLFTTFNGRSRQFTVFDVLAYNPLLDIDIRASD